MPAGAPKGSKNALGHGRKSAYSELADAKQLQDMFFGIHNQDELEQMIRTGKFSVKVRMMLTAMEGDTKALTAMFNKVFPDKMEVKDETSLKIDI